ncbi:reverse transcriptase [Gossypium australe]|uniref:Reverse transcriptase n=1 Tax=Gossypium australe TaxID=47621 RepID=A0A5B6WE19_9ROSI|nr:reverse transcriptase [Gossypium australe]
MYTREKIRGAAKDERQMEKFQKILGDCELFDMGFIEKKFTWERGNFVNTNTRETLDRGVANNEWLNLFHDFSVKRLPHSFSDHCPLFIQTEKNENRYGSKSQVTLWKNYNIFELVYKDRGRISNESVIGERRICGKDWSNLMA